MIPVSANSIKIILSLLAVPVLVYTAAMVEPNGVVQVVFWLVGFGLLASCFVHLGRLLVERGQRWTFLIPGCFILLVGALATLLAMFLVGGASGTNDPTATIAVGVAILLVTFGSALHYNARRLGLVDAVIVTFLQTLFAIVLIALIWGWKSLASKLRRY